MKKIVLLISILIGTGCIVNAQVHVIPKLGVNISNVHFDSDNDWEGQKSLLGFTAGLGIKTALGKVLFFQPELLFSQKGYSAKQTGTIGYDFNYRLNYIEIPLMLGAQFGGDAVKVYLNVGPSIGMMLGGKVNGNWNFGGLNGDYDKSIEFKDNPNKLNLNELNANRFELGLNSGGGVTFWLAENLNAFIDVRYNASLTDYNKETNQSKNSLLAITTGLQIKL